MDELRELSLFADGVRIAEGCRMRLRGRATMSLRPDLWELTVHLLPEDAAGRIHDAKVLDVKGQEESLLVRGQVEEIYTHTDNNKDMTTIVISDGMDFWMSSVSLSLRAGNSIQKTIRTLVEQCSRPVPIVAIRADDATLFRGQAFHGRTAVYISELAKSMQSRAYFTRGGLFIFQKGRSTDTITFGSQDIMNRVAQAEGAYIVQIVGMRGFPVGQTIKLPDSAASYRLLCQTIDADSMKGLWKTELILVDETQIDNWNDWGGGC